MDEIEISVVIPAYNEEKYLPKLIEQIQKQKTTRKYEIIVVNNNSTDLTIPLINEK